MLSLKNDAILRESSIARAIRENNARLVIIDPVQAFLGADVDMNRANEVRPIFRSLGDIAQATGCAIVLIGHLNKAVGTQSTYRGLGSIDITAAVRSLLFIGKLKDNPTTRVLIHEKSSLAPPGQSLAFSLGDEKGFEWIGAYDITADELLAGTDTAKTESKTAQAQMLILELLADGKRMPSAELEKAVNHEVEPREDNMLKITSDGRKLALDQRLSDPTLPDDPESKVNVCVRNVLQVWRDTEEIKGTQLVFCDLSTPKGDGSFNVYDDMKQKLMAQGVPPEEIAFIHDAKTEAQKAELFAKVRKGQVRVLLGSTAKMGAGTNVQTRLAALHHLDCPWRPADIEQREGRILRQGNINKTVKIYKYVTENTFDAYNWSILENKQKFIGQLMSGKNPSRSCEDVDEAALSYAEVKALASGDPRIIEMTDLDSQVTKLKLLKANHESQRYSLEDQLIQFFPKAISRTQEQITGLEQDFAVVQSHPLPDKEHFSITVAGQTYTERKAAGQAIIDACTKMTDVSQRVALGEYRGFPMTLWADTVTQKFQVTMKHSLSHTIELGSDPVGNITRLENALVAIAEDLEQNRDKLANLTAQMEEAKLEVKRPFPQEQELTEKISRLNVLRIALNMDGKSTGKRERDKEELDGGKPSIKGMLKRLGVESAATASPPQKGKDMEVAI